MILSYFEVRQKTFFFIFSFFLDFFGILVSNDVFHITFVYQKIVISDSQTTSNNHKLMNFRYKDKSFNENIPNDPKNLNLKIKKMSLSVSHHFYDPKNENWSILVGFDQNRKFLGNRQTM